VDDNKRRKRQKMQSKKRRKEAQGATNTETVLKHVHDREAAWATEKVYHALEVSVRVWGGCGCED
jgi:hypothetical protein